MHEHSILKHSTLALTFAGCLGLADNAGAALVSRWTMDNGDFSGTTVNDVVSGFNGTATNGGPTLGVAGVLGQAAEFAGGANNGNNHFIDLGVHAGVASSLSQGSVAAWIKPDTTGLTTDVLTIFSVSNASTGSAETRFWVSNGGAFGTGTLAYGTRGGPTNGSMFSSSTTLLDGQWHHVAVTVDGSSTATIYIDGVAENSATIGFLDIPSANAAAIGRNKDSTAGGGQWFYDGLIDDVRLYDHALSGAEVAALVPEPSTGLLLAGSLLGLLVRRHRQRA